MFSQGQIHLVYYTNFSRAKIPFGFSLDPAKWTVETTDSTQRTQSSPVTATWYNLGSDSITIPIGCWDVHYKVALYVDRSAAGDVIVQSTLSTANNSESDNDFTCDIRNGDVKRINSTVVARKHLTLIAATTYYLNTSSQQVSAATIGNINDRIDLIIRAVCAYL